MKISIGSRIKNLSNHNGYGYATERMVHSLKKLGHEVRKNDTSAPAQIWFEQPHHWKWNDSDQYRIGYHPWESTKLKDGWVDLMNECDEIWTPSPLIAKWYADDGIEKPIYVYEHGVDSIWKPRKRVDDGKIKFLHVGGEALRKGGKETMEAFRKAFPDRNDVSLTMKVNSDGWNISNLGRTRIINNKMPVLQLVSMFRHHDIYVYPSMGEGFGLTPLQALATGMPTITVPDWAPYSDFLDERLNLPASLGPSPFHEQGHHPGEMFHINVDDLVDRMRYAADNYEDLHTAALSQTEQIFKRYNWVSLTDEVFGNLAHRLENR
jgi:hypothetical protein